MKLLIVDDYKNMRNVLISMYGYMFDEIFEASDGIIALELYKEHLPDWVLMDVKMEKMDGITATQKINQFDNKAKIVIVTLFDDSDTKENAINAGAIAIIVKNDLTKIGKLISEKFIKHWTVHEETELPEDNKKNNENYFRNGAKRAK